MARTSPPPKLGKSGIISLTPGQLTLLSGLYKPPLTALERAKKNELEANMPDMTYSRC